MVKLEYDLDKIKESPYVIGRCLAELKGVVKTTSRAGNDMLKFDWLILSGPNKNRRIPSYAALLPGSGGMGLALEHMFALGLSDSPRSLDTSLDKDTAVLGRKAVLVLKERPTTKPGRTEPFVGVAHVLRPMPSDFDT